MNNAKYILEGLKSAGYTVSGGVNAPYIWLKAPNGMTSWEFFDFLLENANVVGTPGSGFGPSGETYFRLTAFGSYENTGGSGKNKSAVEPAAGIVTKIICGLDGNQLTFLTLLSFLDFTP